MTGDGHLAPLDYWREPAGDDGLAVGHGLSEAGAAMLEMKGASSRLSSAQAELAALRAALDAERQAKDAAANELTTYETL